VFLFFGVPGSGYRTIFLKWNASSLSFWYNQKLVCFLERKS